jgi:hypothetical protein
MDLASKYTKLPQYKYKREDAYINAYKDTTSKG